MWTIHWGVLALKKELVWSRRFEQYTWPTSGGKKPPKTPGIHGTQKLLSRPGKLGETGNQPICSFCLAAKTWYPGEFVIQNDVCGFLKHLNTLKCCHTGDDIHYIIVTTPVASWSWWIPLKQNPGRKCENRCLQFHLSSPPFSLFAPWKNLQAPPPQKKNKINVTKKDVECDWFQGRHIFWGNCLDFRNCLRASTTEMSLK